ncbi:MAG: tol-pal system protein YbgF [Burkholderiaceae bacterium]|nr:tol-pal system protein YbgF [Burkholderiaceae bacterium]
MPIAAKSGIRPLFGAVAAAALVALSSPAHALFEDEEARKAILDLRARIDVITRDYSAQLRNLGERLERLEGRSQGSLTLQNEIQRMREEIASLRGQLEVQTNALTVTQQRQLEQFATIDARMKRFEPVQVVIDGKNATVDQAERRAFEAALAQVRAGDFKGASVAFEQFQVQFPESAYAPSAAFWLGSSQFALKNYKGAIATHKAMVAKFPDNPRAPDAMLNLAYAQIESGDVRTGKKTLKSLLDRYPRAGAAQAARDRLASLR